MIKLGWESAGSGFESLSAHISPRSRECPGLLCARRTPLTHHFPGSPQRTDPSASPPPPPSEDLDGVGSLHPIVTVRHITSVRIVADVSASPRRHPLSGQPSYQCSDRFADRQAPVGRLGQVVHGAGHRPVDAITQVDDVVHISTERTKVAGGPIYDPSVVPERSYYGMVYGHFPGSPTRRRAPAPTQGKVGPSFGLFSMPWRMRLRVAW
ncbi:hypothetical protein EV646_11396 [Kribbella antiqua]|uniref:Uncharacterized protein n=1 Tax=Kribbella antiqua TaxID=2512217 RepID=A0A4R2ID26_9ACTN|nr:hypothetical protein EV646_11396 [Kribbella antiqua]